MSWSDPPPSRRRFLAALMLGSVSALAAGCGFQPIYAPTAAGGARSDLPQIEVAPPGSRLAQLVWVPLMDRLNPTGREVQKLFRLDMAVTEGESGVLITRGDQITRVNLTLSAAFNLVDLGTNQSLFTGTARSVASYNVLTSDYANLTAYDDARRRAAAELAEQIALRLGVLFSSPQTG